MADYSLPKKNTAYVFEWGLADYSSPLKIKHTPTLAAGDVKVYGDGALVGNIGTLPAEIGTSGILTVSLTAAEMNYDRVVIGFEDQTNPPEWINVFVPLPTSPVVFGELALAATALSTAVWTNAKAAFLDNAVSGVAAAVWAVGSRTLTSFGTLVQDIWDKATSTLTTAGSIGKLLATNIDATISSVVSGGLTAAAVWTYATRTLTQTAAQIAAVLAGSTITIHRGDTFSASLTGITAYTGWDKLWFTVKGQLQEGDRRSAVQILLSDPGVATDGLQVINGQAATAADGSLTADNAALGNVTINIEAAATRQLTPGTQYTYDVQALIGSDVVTLAAGSLTVSADVTRAVS